MKRIADLILACIGLALVAPIVPLLALAIKLETSGPILFIQERLGKDQKLFRCLKFRTMRHGEAGSAWTVVDDPRITSVGRVLRAIHLDEAPQLINVLRGDMSVVGPRPLVEHEAETFGALKYPYSKRFRVKPGITGLAQVSVAPDAHLAKFRLDVFYVIHRSVWLDLMIMGRTVVKIIGLRDVHGTAWRRNAALDNGAANT